MADSTKVKIDHAVGKNMIKVQVSRAFGPSEQLNAEMDVPIEQADQAVNLMYQKVIEPRVKSFQKEAIEYQLEQDLMAYESRARDIILEHQDDIDEVVRRVAEQVKQQKEVN